MAFNQLKVYQTLQSSVSSCLKEVVDQFTEVVNQAKECLKPITALQEDLPTMETEDRTEGTQQRNSNTTHHLVKGSTDISTALSFVLTEEKERSKRQLNLILHDLEEASGGDAVARKH